MRDGRPIDILFIDRGIVPAVASDGVVYLAFRSEFSFEGQAVVSEIDARLVKLAGVAGREMRMKEDHAHLSDAGVDPDTIDVVEGA